MNARPDAMSRTAKDFKPVSPRALYVTLILLVLLGMAGTAASVVSARSSQAATKADVTRNLAVLDRLATLEALQRADDEAHRQSNAIEHDDLCRLVADIAAQAGITTTPCRAVATPQPRPAPYPSTPSPSPSP